MQSLYLNLKTEYFDQIKCGSKTEEYRLYNDFWKKRLMHNGEFRQFKNIVIRLGYPKAGDPEKEIERPWQGVVLKNIVHPHFGNQPKHVFAIKVN